MGRQRKDLVWTGCERKGLGVELEGRDEAACNVLWRTCQRHQEEKHWDLVTDWSGAKVEIGYLGLGF